MTGAIVPFRKLKDDPDAVLVGLIADIADPVDFLVLDHLGNAR